MMRSLLFKRPEKGYSLLFFVGYTICEIYEGKVRCALIVKLMCNLCETLHDRHMRLCRDYSTKYVALCDFANA